MEKKPYQALAETDRCGAFQLAEASVAVPFVGAAIGALTVTQALRLGAMEGASSLMQMELSAPDFNSANSLNPKPIANLGSMPLDLRTGEFVV